MTIGRNRRDFIALDKEDIVVESYDNSSRQDPGVDPGKRPFEEYARTLTEEQVRRETARCLSCGASVDKFSGILPYMIKRTGKILFKGNKE